MEHKSLSDLWLWLVGRTVHLYACFSRCCAPKIADLQALVSCCLPIFGVWHGAQKSGNSPVVVPANLLLICLQSAFSHRFALTAWHSTTWLQRRKKLTKTVNVALVSIISLCDVNLLIYYTVVALVAWSHGPRAKPRSNWRFSCEKNLMLILKRFKVFLHVIAIKNKENKVKHRSHSNELMLLNVKRGTVNVGCPAGNRT